MAKKREHTVEQLEQYLRQQIAFLQRSASAYDEGYKSESMRLATTLRVLLHDTRNCHSLLGLLKLKRELRYRSTSLPLRDDDLLRDFFPLVILHTHVGPPESAMEYVPAFVAPPPRVKHPRILEFREWWKEVVVALDVEVDVTRATFSRRDLVLNMCDKQGGAHVDPTLDEDYATLVLEPSRDFYWRQTKPVFKERQPVPRQGVAPASIRQIVYELLLTLEEVRSQYFEH